jgi:hypothetical protein
MAPILKAWKEYEAALPADLISVPVETCKWMFLAGAAAVYEQFNLAGASDLQQELRGLMRLELEGYLQKEVL